MNNIQALPNQVLVRDLQFGETVTRGGIIFMDDDGKLEGIKPRWALVWRVGDNVLDIKEGDWILIEHGRWTRSIEVTALGEKFKINGVDKDCILMLSDEKPQ